MVPGYTHTQQEQDENMSEFQSALKPYNLEAALAADHGEDCVIFDVGHDATGQSVASFKEVVDKVGQYLSDMPETVASTTKLYVIGRWRLTPTEVVESDSVAISVSHEQLRTCLSLQERDHLGVNAELVIFQERAHATTKWMEATQKLKSLIEQMGNLKELT
jgi:hypothetical protein